MTTRRRNTLGRLVHTLLCLVCLAWPGLFKTASSRDAPKAPPVKIRGEPLNTPPPPASNAAPRFAAANAPAANQPDTVKAGFIQLGFDKLASFPYEVCEVYSETAGGRALLKSTNVIPQRIKEYNGKRVTVTGFVLPLRLKNQLVQEFLLVRDQGSCCYGQMPQLNHFIRVRVTGVGFPPGVKTPYEVSGILHVGEIYVDEYLTGLYSLDAEMAEVEDTP